MAKQQIFVFLDELYVEFQQDHPEVSLNVYVKK